MDPEPILQFARNNPHTIANGSFREQLIAHLHIEDLVALDELLKSIHLIRSMDSFIASYEEQLTKNPHMVEHMKYLQTIEQPEQRTPEWYNFRYDHITASNAWKAYSPKEKVKNQLIYEKCKPMDTSKYNSTLTETPMSWGHKYEPLTIQFYERLNDTTISDFGCIKHNEHNFLAASPDGIVTGNNNFGRMIEVKNVVSRVINGIPKEDYYIQMQLQMEVCNLDECDFIETKFMEYDGYNEYMEDGSGYLTHDQKHKGIIKVYVNNNDFVYEYMDLSCTNVEEWLDTEHSTYEWFKNVYWKLDVYSCVYVPRCKLWFKETFHEIQNVWNIILLERENGTYHTRQPTKRIKKEVVNLNACLITL
jgi:putative phage-type endonuclease